MCMNLGAPVESGSLDWYLTMEEQYRITFLQKQLAGNGVWHTKANLLRKNVCNLLCEICKIR